MSYKQYIIDRLEEETLDEGIKDWILPIILGTALISNAYGKDNDSFIDKIKNADASKTISSLIQKTPDQWEKTVKKISNLQYKNWDEEIQKTLNVLGKDKDIIMKQIKNESFDVIVDKNMKDLIKVDVDNKKIYVKDISLMDNVKDIINKGILNVEKNITDTKEKIKEIEKDNVKKDEIKPKERIRGIYDI